MPVPFETLLPYAIMIGMFGITGTGLAVVKTWRNEGKRPRYSLDQWDRQSKRLAFRGTRIPEWKLTESCKSDGTRPQTHRNTARADSKARSTPRLRIQQWLEVGKTIHLNVSTQST
ncbi:hypothetical protein E4U41_007232 [Claviceps citrina]|nr:hypothetical protein E4U41_007232 [Claviceps citrina]